LLGALRPATLQRLINQHVITIIIIIQLTTALFHVPQTFEAFIVHMLQVSTLHMVWLSHIQHKKSSHLPQFVRGLITPFRKKDRKTWHDYVTDLMSNSGICGAQLCQDFPHARFKMIIPTMVNTESSRSVQRHPQRRKMCHGKCSGEQK